MQRDGLAANADACDGASLEALRADNPAGNVWCCSMFVDRSRDCDGLQESLKFKESMPLFLSSDIDIQPFSWSGKETAGVQMVA